MLRLFFFSLVFASTLLFSEQEALIIVPVADLVGSPLGGERYQDLPFSGANCSRIHQSLFNERVIIVEDREHEVKVKIPNFYYLQDESLIPQNTFWTLKKNLLVLDEHKKIDRKKIPPPSLLRAM